MHHSQAVKGGLTSQLQASLQGRYSAWVDGQNHMTDHVISCVFWKSMQTTFFKK